MVVAAALGYLAGLTRPLGVLLVAPVAVETIRWWRRLGGAERLASVVASAAPLAGLGTFLGWSAGVFGDGLLPLRVQTEAGHHGALSDPFTTLADDARGVLHHHVGTALHVPWVALVVVLVVLCWMRMPTSYALFSTAVVLVAVTGTNLDSFERYALSAFPLVVVGASLLGRPSVERPVLIVAGAAMTGYALLAFINLVVP